MAVAVKQHFYGIEHQRRTWRVLQLLRISAHHAAASCHFWSNEPLNPIKTLLHSDSHTHCASAYSSTTVIQIYSVPIDGCEDIVLQVDVADAERGSRKDSLSEHDDFSEV